MKVGNILARFTTNLDWLLFLRGRLRLLLAWLLLAFVTGIVGWTILRADIDNDRRQAEGDALKAAIGVSKVYADYLAQTIASIDQLMLHVRYEWELSQGLLPLESFQETGILPSPDRIYVFIIDSEGRVLTRSLTRSIPGVEGVTVEDRLYFLVQKHASTDMLYISKATWGRISNLNVIHFSRRLLDRNGLFSGVVLVSVVADYFTTPYDETTLGKRGFLGVIGTDRMVRVGRIGKAIYPPETPALSAIPDVTAATGGMPLDGEQWFADRRSRYVGWNAVPGYPLIALAGSDRQDALAPFYAARTAKLRNASWATIALAVFTLTAMAFSVRLAWSKFQIERTQVTYRMATEEGNEGFYIVRQVTDKNGVVLDFDVVDCNHQGAAFYGAQRQQVIGRKLSSFYKGEIFERLMERMQQALETGSYESEIEVPTNSPIRTRWLHLKIVRSNGYLAMRVRDLTDTKAHFEALERRGNEDALTALPNRHWVNTFLPQAIENAEQQATMLALLFIDLDGFKAINDTMGHEAGDELLRTAGRRLREAVRPQDHVVRIGGDEFVVILENIQQKIDAAHVAERVLRAFQEKFRLTQGIASVGTSIGISLFPTDGTTADTLLKSADIAMYSVKTTGKRNYRFYDQQFYEALRARHEKEAELRHAIEHDQFVMYYQPRVDVASGMTVSMEALVRWAHPRKGLLEPLEFIPMAEETGLILGLGEIVIDKVCAQLAFWSSAGHKHVPVSINVSPRQFNEADIAHLLSAALKRHNIDPRLVEIELTESVMMGEQEGLSKALNAIQAMGVKLSIDDFGTGYSSLSQLQQLDFDVLKVDRAFTSKVDKTDQGNVFFKAIITMAHSLGMRVVAEGVENERQIRILKSLRCDEIQGFYISRPLPPSETQSLLTRRFLPATI